MDGGCKVQWIPHDEYIRCSCHLFEFSGILCRHILRVLSTNNCFHIPEKYLPLRWHNVCPSLMKPYQNAGEYTEKLQMLQSMVSTLLQESIETEERLDVACDKIAAAISRVKEFPAAVHGSNDIAYNSPSDSLILPEVEDSDGMIHSLAAGNSQESINMGKLKEGRPRDSNDIYRKRRHCSISCCGQFGHDAAECPMMQGDDLNGDGLGFL